MRRPLLIQRSILLLAAIAAAAWLAVALGDQRALDDATATLRTTGPSRASLEQALSDTEHAKRLRERDQAPDVLRARILAGLYRRPEALALLEHVVRREPDNLDAWFSIAVLSADEDKPLTLQARRRLAQLDPIAAGR